MSDSSFGKSTSASSTCLLRIDVLMEETLVKDVGTEELLDIRMQVIVEATTERHLRHTKESTRSRERSGMWEKILESTSAGNDETLASAALCSS